VGKKKKKSEIIGEVVLDREQLISLRHFIAAELEQGSDFYVQVVEKWNSSTNTSEVEFKSYEY